jgi:hypothetical protein
MNKNKIKNFNKKFNRCKFDLPPLHPFLLCPPLALRLHLW